MSKIEMDSPNFFEPTLFTEQPREPKLFGYEKAMPEFDEIIVAIRLLKTV